MAAADRGAGRGTQAMKTLIFQAQMLRGSAQLAVQSELRSIMQMASDDRDEAKRNAEGGAGHSEGAGAGAGAGAESTLLTEHDDNALYFSTACHPSNRPYYAPFDVDEFLAPSCNQCGWLYSTCACCQAADAGASAGAGDAALGGEPEEGEDAAAGGAAGRKDGADGDQDGVASCTPQAGKRERRTSLASKPVNTPV